MKAIAVDSSRGMSGEGMLGATGPSLYTAVAELASFAVDDLQPVSTATDVDAIAYAQ
jgi:hypothetical protein